MKKAMIYVPFLILILSGLAGFVNAGTCTINKPEASAIISGDYKVNITTASGYDQFVQNCTVVATSVKTGDTWTLLAINNTNATSDSGLNDTASSTSVRDADDYSFAVTCMNETAKTVDTCTRTGVTIDNTVPVCSPDLSSNTDYDPTVNTTITLTATNATEQCTANFYGTGFSTFVSGLSNTTCSFTVLNKIVYGKYSTIAFTTSDNLNETGCSVTSVSFTQKSSGGLSPQAYQAVQERTYTPPSSGGKNNNWMWWIILVIVLIVIFKWDDWFK